MKEKILIIGQLPPPYHGSNVMAKVMLTALEKKHAIIFINKAFAKSIETIGKPSLRKFFRVPVLAIKILFACMISRPTVCIYFVAVGKSAFIVDAFLLLLIRLCRVPYILRFGGKGYYKLKGTNFFYNFIVSITLSNALGGIVLGQSIKWDVNIFISEKNLVCVPNGLDYYPIMQPKTSKNFVQILYLSNLIPTKGPYEVLKAAKIIIHKKRNVRFILAGASVSKSFTQKLKLYIDDEGLKEYILMPGKVIGAEKEKLFANSDIFVFPTYFKREIFGTVNVEAMSWGLPVITSNEGVISEIVHDGINGFIVNPRSPEEIAEKILLLIDDSDLRIKLGNQGRKDFESKYTFKAHDRHLDKAIRYFLNNMNLSK
jgi:glycosyltransferase involved in cell wall biosynthesis